MVHVPGAEELWLVSGDMFGVSGEGTRPPSKAAFTSGEEGAQPGYTLFKGFPFIVCLDLPPTGRIHTWGGPSESESYSTAPGTSPSLFESSVVVSLLELSSELSVWGIWGVVGMVTFAGPDYMDPIIGVVEYGF